MTVDWGVSKARAALMGDLAVLAAEVDERGGLGDGGGGYFADEGSVVAGVDDLGGAAFERAEGLVQDGCAFGARGPRYAGEAAFRELGEADGEVALIGGQEVDGEMAGVFEGFEGFTFAVDGYEY